ncbi:MAG: T9SS type A sorting domain-containing protein [Bacteroidota bacterium]
MKNFYFLLVLLAFGPAGFAQSFTVTPGTNATLPATEGREEEATIYFTNDRSTDIDLVWTQSQNTLNPNWSVSICDNNLCYFSAYPGDTMLPVAAGTNGFLKFTCEINPGDVGSGVLAYNVSISGEPSTMVEVIFSVDGTVSLTPASFANSIKIGPNPVSRTLTLRATNGALEKGTVEVYNLEGRLLGSHTVRGVDAMDVDVSTLPEGAYLLRYFSDKGIVTRRFVRQN